MTVGCRLTRADAARVAAQAYAAQSRDVRTVEVRVRAEHGWV